MSDEGLLRLYEDEPDRIMITNESHMSFDELMPYAMFVINNKQWSLDKKARKYQSNTWRDVNLEIRASINPPRKNGLISVTLKVLTLGDAPCP